MGPAEQRALIAITDPLAEPIGIQRKWPFGSREARELEQENDRTRRSPGRIRHSLAHDLVTRPHLDQHIFDARPLARLHASIQSGDRPSTAKTRAGWSCELFQEHDLATWPFPHTK